MTPTSTADTRGRFTRVATVAVVIAVSCVAARAEIDLPEPNLTLYSDGDSYLKTTIQVDNAVFVEGNAWFGESRRNAGDHVDSWGELGVVRVWRDLSHWEASARRARVSGVWTTTQLELDAAGSNLDERYPKQSTLEDAYFGWSSGDLLPGLGKDAIDLSFGRQS